MLGNIDFDRRCRARGIVSADLVGGIFLKRVSQVKFCLAGECELKRRILSAVRHAKPFSQSSPRETRRRYSIPPRALWPLSAITRPARAYRLRDLFPF